MDRELLVSQCSQLLQDDQPEAAARLILDFSGQPCAKITSTQVYETLNYLLHWCLNNNHYDWAARLMWGENLFNPNPRSTKMIWKAFQENFSVMLMGAASLSKSFSGGIWLFLDWLRDPEYTTVRVVGPNEAHLEANLFSHLVRLHRESKIPLPGIVGELFIGLDTRNRVGSISGVVIPVGKTKKSGRLQGLKRVPRPKPHPVFGRLSRLRIFIDEMEVVPIGIWKDIDNVLSNVDGIEGFKIAGAFNPEDQNGPAGTRCEPVGGWKEVDIDTSETWKSKRGWQVVRLDAFKCENVVENRIIYPGLQTKEGLDAVIQNAGGYNTPGYYTMARAWFPPDGINFSVIPNSLLSVVKGDYIWAGKTTSVAGADIALEGSDNAEVALGQWGVALGVRLPPTIKNPKGEEIYFKNTNGRTQARYALQLDQIFSLPRADTVEMEKNLRELFISLSIQPDWVLLDRTGNGVGVHDLMRSNWSTLVRGSNFSENATKMKIMADDLKPADEVYEKLVSELWFATRKYIEFGYLKISPLVDTETLFLQLSSRLFSGGRKSRVESKREYKTRGHKSPDKADALSLMIHCARLASGIVVGVQPEVSSDDYDGGDESEMYCKVDVTNRFRDDL